MLRNEQHVLVHAQALQSLVMIHPSTSSLMYICLYMHILLLSRLKSVSEPSWASSSPKDQAYTLSPFIAPYDPDTSSGMTVSRSSSQALAPRSPSPSEQIRPLCPQPRRQRHCIQAMCHVAQSMLRPTAWCVVGKWCAVCMHAGEVPGIPSSSQMMMG